MPLKGQTRRRLSTTLNVDTSISDEAVELLNYNERPSSPRFTHSLWKCGYNKPQDLTKWLCAVSIAFGLFMLAIFALRSSAVILNYPIFTTSAHNSDSGSQYRQSPCLGIRLHPEQHVHRQKSTITHNWNITSGFRSPDGVQKLIYLANNQFPGPTIECRSGDRLVIHVTNHLDSREGISIHWHGLEMRNANSMDGAAGLTQCLIPAGKTFIYDFDVSQDQAGTFWWHAHSQMQRGDGMYGGLVVHKPITIGDGSRSLGYENDFLLMIGDWYHRSADEVLAWYTSPRGFGNEPVPDSILINGAGKFNCSMAPPARPVECVNIEEQKMARLFPIDSLTKLTRLRLVNVGSLAGFTVKISFASLTPLTIDGGFNIAGTRSGSVGILYPGERVDVIVKWDNSTDVTLSQLHVDLDPENFKYPNHALRSNQSFPIFSNSRAPASLEWQNTKFTHFDLASATALITSQIPRTAQQTILLYAKTQKLSIFGNRPIGFMNRTSWSPQSTPSLPLLSLTRSQWDKNQLLPYIPVSGFAEKWVDIIINNLDDGAHPFHLHGYSFYIIASHRSEHGWGSYNPYSPTSVLIQPMMNLNNPVKKDTVSVPRRGYVVIRLKADNVGIWMLHCHVLFHQGSGMAMGIQVGGTEGHEGIDIKSKELCSGL
ncbi:multicopper oxidase-domain-containing protein [Tricladium varicosporioides]|nr:multicopper oxidase-domain-containing protein [Hymenoscyphus varicosporioides]